MTYYDLGSGGRVELSVATFDNWVNKTAGLLRDELDVEPGQTVSVVLPAHWLGLVWAMGVWTVGAHLALEPHRGAVVSVRAGDETAGGGAVVAGELVAVATLPLGGPAGPAASAAGALDYGREVLGYPDVFGAAEPCDDPLFEQMVERLLPPSGIVVDGQRLLVVADRLDAETLRTSLLSALVADGSTVLVRTDARSGDPKRIAAIARDENAVLAG